MSPVNKAAWQPAAKVSPLEIGESPYPSPKAHEFVIRVRAAAVNPVDWAMQEYALWEVSYPTIWGIDAAGEVVEVGSDVTDFKVGDRVVGHCDAFREQSPAYSAFQLYTVLKDNISARIPETLSFEQASVLPCCLSTAATGLYCPGTLELPYPQIDPKPTGEVIVVWGGSSSVGSNAIQLAVASGYEVFTTASSKNFEYVKSLGATKSFDYNESTIVDDVVKALQGKKLGGIYHAAGRGDEFQKCIAIADKSEGKKTVFTAIPIPPDQQTYPDGVTAKFLFGSDIISDPAGKAVWVDFVQPGLENGKFIAAPEALVVGKGLESVQTAFEVQKKGMSAKKVVVSL